MNTTESQIIELKQQLSDKNDRCYALTREFVARGKLFQSEIAELTKDRDEWKESCEDANARFKSAEQRIRESREQECVYQQWSVSRLSWLDVQPITYEGLPEHSRRIVYKQPIIPPSLEELQRENAELKAELVAEVKNHKAAVARADEFVKSEGAWRWQGGWNRPS